MKFLHVTSCNEKIIGVDEFGMVWEWDWQKSLWKQHSYPGVNAARKPERVCELERDHWWTEKNGKTVCENCEVEYEELTCYCGDAMESHGDPFDVGHTFTPML